MRYGKLILMSVLPLTLAACSGVNFGAKGKTQSSQSANGGNGAQGTNTGGDGASGQIGQPGTTPSPSPTPAPGPVPGPGPSPMPSPTPGSGAVLPKIQFIGPPCKQQSMCLVRFVLDAPVSGTFEFDWKTNDTLYQQPEPAGATYQYAQPAVHYISTNGHAKFLPGEVEKQVYIQNINPYNYEIVIGVIMSICQYNGNLGNCTSFFH